MAPGPSGSCLLWVLAFARRASARCRGALENEKAAVKKGHRVNGLRIGRKNSSAEDSRARLFYCWCIAHSNNRPV